MDVHLYDPAAIQVGDVIRYGCLVLGVCFAAAALRLLTNPRMQEHPEFPGFRFRLFGLALGVALSVVLQYDRLGEPVNVLTLSLSVLLLGVAFYSVWLPTTTVRESPEDKLRDY